MCFHHFTEGLTISLDKCWWNVEVTDDLACSVFSVQLSSINFTVEGKADRLTEVLVQEGFLSRLFFFIGLFSCVFVRLTVYVGTNDIRSSILRSVGDFIFKFFGLLWVTRSSWEEFCQAKSIFTEWFRQFTLVLSIVEFQFYIWDVDLVFIPVVFILGHFDRRFWSKALQDVRTIVKKGAGVTCLSEFIPFWFHEFFVDRESDPKSQFRVPVRFWLVQSDLKGMIINCFYSYSWEIFIFTTDVVIQAFDRILDDVEHFWFVISRIFDPCDEIFSCYIRILFAFWIIPFSIITKFISISQAILRNCPIFCKRWNQVPVFIIFKQTINQVSSDIVGCCFTRCDIV